MESVTKTCIRLRKSELTYARREAKRLGCGASDILRAALARIQATPLQEHETKAVVLPRGAKAQSRAAVRRWQQSGVEAARVAKNGRNARNSGKTLSPQV